MQAPLPTILAPPPLPDGSDAPARSPERHANIVRFQSELEFVHCLAHPQYLHELHIQGYLAKPEFLNYLRYLEYWREPDYVRFIIYPTCLVYLTLLQTEMFRSRLGDMGFIMELIRVGTKHHSSWRVEKPPEKMEEEPLVPGPVVDDEDEDDQYEADDRDKKERRRKKKGKAAAGI